MVRHSISLKRETRDMRGKGICRKVLQNTPIPVSWQNFLRVDENKTELYEFICNTIMQSMTVDEKEIYCTKNQIVCSLPNHPDDPYLSPSTQEESDTMVMLHTAHCVEMDTEKF